MRHKGLVTILAMLVSATLACTKSKEDSAAEKSKEDQKKVFNFFRTSAHKSLDPMKQFDEASADIVINVYDTLIQYHYLARPYKLVPNLLTTMPEKQKDGVTYILTLKKGIRFHDDPAFPGGKGRELNADDVIYSVKRFADANVNVLSYVLIKGFVVGLDDFRAQTKKLGKKTDYSKLKIAGLKKLDSHRLSLKFTSDNPLALYPFAFSGMSIIAKEAVEKYGNDFEKHPVGTGPFYIKEYSRRGEMVLAKNENYHGAYPDFGEGQDKSRGLLKDAGKKLPLLDEVRLPLIEEAQPAMLKFKKGELDWIGMNKDDFNQMAYRDKNGEFHLKDEFREKFDMYTEPGLSAAYIAFNLKDPIVGKNKKLRQAIALSLDVQKWIDLMRNGRGEPLNSIVPHPIAGSERDTNFKYWTRNVVMAKQKLKEAGYPGGKGLPTLTIEFRSTSKQTRQDFEYIRNELAEVGIKVKANFQTFSAFLKRTDSGNFQMADAGWGADYPDAENFYQLLYGPNKTPGPNMSEFNHAEYNKLYETTKYMLAGPERHKHFSRMNEILKEEIPLILRWNPLRFGLYQKRVKNLKRNIMVNPPLKYINIDYTGAKVSE